MSETTGPVKWNQTQRSRKPSDLMISQLFWGLTIYWVLVYAMSHGETEFFQIRGNILTKERKVLQVFDSADFCVFSWKPMLKGSMRAF